MSKEILCYKLTNEQKNIVEEATAGQFFLTDTDLPEDIIVNSAFMVILNVDNENRKKVMDCINFMGEYLNYIILDENIMHNTQALQDKIGQCYEKYNNTIIEVDENL